MRIKSKKRIPAGWPLGLTWYPGFGGKYLKGYIIIQIPGRKYEIELWGK